MSANAGRWVASVSRAPTQPTRTISPGAEAVHFSHIENPGISRFFVAQPILAVLLSGSWTISRAWRMTPVYLSRSKGLPYQKLSDLYLLDCAKKRKKLTMKWVA